MKKNEIPTKLTFRTRVSHIIQEIKIQIAERQVRKDQITTETSVIWSKFALTRVVVLVFL